MEKTRMTISLAGQEFRICSENEPEYMKALADSVNRRIREVHAQFPDQSTSRCALLAMLDMADELKKLREMIVSGDREGMRELMRYSTARRALFDKPAEGD